MSQDFTISKKLLSIKLKDIIHHPVYEKFIPFYHNLNQYFQIYSKSYVDYYTVLNPPVVIKNESKYICIHNFVSYFLANITYSEETKINCLEIKEINIKDENRFILQLIVHDLLKLFPAINKNIEDGNYFKLIKILLEENIIANELSIKNFEDNQLTNSYKIFDILKENFNINKPKELFIKIFPITENTLKNKTEDRQKNKFIAKEYLYEFYIDEFFDERKVEIKLKEFARKIDIEYKYEDSEEIHKIKINKKDIKPFYEFTLEEQKFLIAPKENLIFLPVIEKNFYIFNISKQKFYFFNFENNKITPFNFIKDENFLYHGYDAILKKDNNEYLFRYSKKDFDYKLKPTNFLIVPLEEKMLEKILKLFEINES